MVRRRLRKIVKNTAVSILVVACIVAMLNYFFYKEGYREGFYKGAQELAEFRSQYTSVVINGKKFFYVINFERIAQGDRGVIVVPFKCTTLTLTDQEAKTLAVILQKAVDQVKKGDAK